MDVHESNETHVKTSSVESSRPPSVLGEKNNETTRRSRARNISSRYMSPTPVAPSGTRRYPSPDATRAGTPPRRSVPKRAISVERICPSTTPSPPRQSTPVQDKMLDTRLASRKVSSNKIQDGLWPSTIRSLNVSFQSHASNKEKPPNSLSGRASKPSSHISRKPEEMAVVTRKATPERKRSPQKGKNAPDQSDNSKPANVLHPSLVEQHMWPSISPSSPLAGTLNMSYTSTKTPSLRRMPISDSMSKPLQKLSSDLRHLASLNEYANSEFGSYKPVFSRFFGKTNIVTPGAKSHSLPTTPRGSRASSPNKAPMSLSSVSRGPSPSRTRATSRGVSPAHSRHSSPTRKSNNSATSVLTFTADIKKGKNAANHIEDVHELRLLYNRHLQWRYANAKANAVLHSQKLNAEKMLYNVCETMSELRDYVVEKRNYLQQLKLRLKIHTVLREHMTYLEDWGSCESEHTSSLSHAVETLRSSILRIPLTGRARGDITTVKAAVCSAVDVLRAMGSSISSILARVEGMNSLVSELADVGARGRAMIKGCESLLASIAALQAEEYSTRSQLLQMNHMGVLTDMSHITSQILI